MSYVMFAPRQYGFRGLGVSTGSDYADAAAKCVSDGNTVKSCAKASAGTAAAAGCAAVGAGIAAPLCAEIGSEVAEWVIDEVWEPVSDFFGGDNEKRKKQIAAYRAKQLGLLEDLKTAQGILNNAITNSVDGLNQLIQDSKLFTPGTQMYGGSYWLTEAAKSIFRQKDPHDPNIPGFVWGKVDYYSLWKGVVHVEVPGGQVKLQFPPCSKHAPSAEWAKGNKANTAYFLVPKCADQYAKSSLEDRVKKCCIDDWPKYATQVTEATINSYIDAIDDVMGVLKQSFDLANINLSSEIARRLAAKRAEEAAKKKPAPPKPKAPTAPKPKPKATASSFLVALLQQDTGGLFGKLFK